MSRRKNDVEPPGYSVYDSSTAFDAYGPVRLLVPTQLQDHIAQERELAIMQREQERERKERERQTTPPVPSRSDRRQSPVLDAGAERAKVETELACRTVRQGRVHPVYDPYEPVRLLERRDNTPDKELHKRDEELYRRLSSKGWLRKVALPKGVEHKLGNLAASQPAFREVITFVHGHLRLARRTGRPPRIPPMLLYGEPGVGKTHFAHSLAHSLGTAWRRQPFDNAETGSVLLGSDRHWGNTRWGVLFELLALGEFANPVIVLDELDKAVRRETRNDPLGPLHTLLEPSTASHVRDLSLDFELDASLVTWIGTANDLVALPQPILSRLRVFHIRQPQGEDAIRTALAVINAALKKVLPRSLAVDRGVAVALAHLTPREQFQATEDAASVAAQAGRRHLRASDLPAWALWEGGGRRSQLLH